MTSRQPSRGAQQPSAHRDERRQRRHIDDERTAAGLDALQLPAEQLESR